MDISLLSNGAIKAIIEGHSPPKPRLQILSIKKFCDDNNDTFQLQLSDGIYKQAGMLEAQLNTKVYKGEIDKYAVIQVEKVITKKKKIVIADLTVLHKGTEIGGDISEEKGRSASHVRQTKRKHNSAGSGTPLKRPALNQPSSSNPISGDQKHTTKQSLSVQSSLSTKTIFPIYSLNPYLNKWTIRVRLLSTPILKPYSNTRGDGQFMPLELVDNSGEIDATAFNKDACRLHPMLEAYKVYYISNGRIQPANTKYTTCNNIYEIIFNAETKVEECLVGGSDLPMATSDGLKQRHKVNIIDQHHLREALRKSGSVKTRINKVIVQGPARAGKTSVKCLILSQPYTTNVSTGCIESPQIAVGEFSMRCYSLEQDECHWKLVDSDAMAGKFAMEIKELIAQQDDDYQSHITDTSMVVKVPLSLPQTAHNSLSLEDVATNDVTQELKGIINKACVNKTKLTLHKEWLYFIDCGGQIQFQQLVQAFVPCASVLMLVINLAKDLSSQSSTVFQCEDECYSVSEHSATVETLLRRLTLMFTSTCHQQQLVEDYKLSGIVKIPEKVKLLAIATHNDKYKMRLKNEAKVETIEEKEVKLAEIFQSIGNNLSYCDVSKGKILYEVDGRKACKKVFDDAVVKEIRHELRDQAFEVDIPLSWYAFQIMLHETAHESCGILPFKKCLSIGLGLSLNKEEVQSALRFFHLLNTLMYYPEVSNLVFVLPHSLIEVVRDLTLLICKIRGNVPIGPGPIDCKKAAEQGILSKDVLTASPKCSQISSFFPDFSLQVLRIFEHLLIAREMSDNNTFFMPALLPLTDPMQSILSSDFHLLYYFPNGAPLGLFCALIVNLLLTTVETDDDFCDNSLWSIDQKFTMYANLVTLQHFDMKESVVFVESNDCYEIYFGSAEDIKKGEKIMYSSLKETIKKRNFDSKMQPMKAFFCPCQEQPCHVAIAHASGKLHCTKFGNFVEDPYRCSLLKKCTLESVGNGNQNLTQPKSTRDQLKDKPSPSELFQENFSNLCDAIGTETIFDRTIDKLFSSDLINQAVCDDVNTTASYSVYEKGRKIVRELHKQIISSANPDKILLKICEVLLSIDDRKLKKTVMKLKKQLPV